MSITIHTDGGARGNPGPAAIGFVVKNDHTILAKEGRPIGIATNNIAEYQAVIAALEWIRDHKSVLQSSIDGRIDMYLDSTLVVNQLNGIYKMRSQHLRSRLLAIRAIEQDLGLIVEYHAIPREENRESDLLVNRALDQARNT